MVSLTFVDRSGVEDPARGRIFSGRSSGLPWNGSTTRSTPSKNGEEAQKDKPRDWCWNYCPYATDCRGRDTDASGLIEDPVTTEAIAAYRVCGQTWGRREDKKSALAVLPTPPAPRAEFAVRWVEVPGGHVEHDRAPYRKIGISQDQEGKS